MKLKMVQILVSIINIQATVPLMIKKITKLKINKKIKTSYWLHIINSILIIILLLFMGKAVLLRKLKIWEIAIN